MVPNMSFIPLYLLPLLFKTLETYKPPALPPSPFTSSSFALSLHFLSTLFLGSMGPNSHPLCSTGHLPQVCPFRVPDLSPFPAPHSPFTSCALHPCPLSFPLASPSSYPPHSPVSPGEKPYVCTVPGCGKRFTEYSSLYKHHVVHTHCKPYTCSTCGKTYRQTSTLAMHKRSAHGELEATEESEQALYEQQQLEGEGHGQEVRGDKPGRPVAVQWQVSAWALLSQPPLQLRRAHHPNNPGLLTFRT